MRIGIDIDDTICSTWETLVPYFCDKFGLNYNKLLNNQGNYKALMDIVGIDKYDEFIEEIISKIILQVPLKEGAKEVINELSIDNEIYFITSRSEEEYDYPYKTSKEFLEKNGIHYDKLIVDAQDKGLVCKNLNVDLFIDDRISNCRSVLKQGIMTLMFETVFNKDCQEFKKISSWNDVKQYVDQLKRR